MKKILGLDIGTTSIGWAIVEATDEKNVNDLTGKSAETDINNQRLGIHKDAVGVRIIAQDTERFDKGLKLNDPKGSTLTPTATRRKYRGNRRMKSRYKLRRDKLGKVLDFIGMNPDKAYYTNKKGNRGENNDIGKAIYKLRDRAINERETISLNEFGRILLHLNQWRGYSSDRFKKDEKQGNKKGDNELFTSIVEDVSFIGLLPNDSRYHYFIILFENGDKGCDIRKITEKESNFSKGQMHTYYFDEKNKEPEIEGIKKIRYTKLDTESYTNRKKTINNKIEQFILEEEQKDKNLGTVGSFFYNFFYNDNIITEDRISRIRNHTINRDWYESEVDKVFEVQFKCHEKYFESLNITEIVKVAFKDYQPVLNEVLKKEGIKEQLKYLIKDKIIFFQRPWQQAKNKGQCPFEKIKIKKETAIKGTGKKEIIEEYVGRTVIPRSHPLFQEFKIWQQINNVRLFYNGLDGKIDLLDNLELFKAYTGKTISEVKQLLYNELQTSKTLSWRNFVKERLGIETYDDLDEKSKERKVSKKGINTQTGEITNSYFSVNFRKRKKGGTIDDMKLKGNSTRASLQNILANKTDDWFNQIHSDKQKITNLQFLWELIYDITNGDANKVAAAIETHFSIDNKEICYQLANLKFDDTGMGNLSAKAIRQILPLMSDGKNITDKTLEKVNSLLNLNNSIEEISKSKDEKLESLKDFIPDKKARLRLSKFNTINDFTYLNYWEATAVRYGSHSTKKQFAIGSIKPVERHSMNNPIVEKIVNETISVVNEIYKIYGFDEVRIELSRELKASMEERQQMSEAMDANAEKNEWAKQMLRELKKEYAELDTEPSTNSNLDKIKIIEDVVKFKNSEEYKLKNKEFKLGEPSKAEVKKYLMWLEQNFKCPYTNQPMPFTDVFAKGKVVEIEHILPRERYYLNSYANKVITWREVNQAKADYGNRTAYEFIVSKRKKDQIEIGNGRVVNLVAKEEWERHVKSMFPKGGKQTNLLRKEIPEDPINRTLNETQYINKKLKEKLSELVGQEKVWVTSGAVTDILRERWHLNDIMKELMRDRFENFQMPTGKKSFKLITLEQQQTMFDRIQNVLENQEGFELYKIPTGKKFIEIKDIEELKKIYNELDTIIKDNTISENKKIKVYSYSTSEEAFETKNLTYFTKQFDYKTDSYIDKEIFQGYSKRLDHRHHAMDAIIIACTKQNHIQYINTLNASSTADQENDDSKKLKYNLLKVDVCIGNSSKRFKTPWIEDKFIPEVRKALSEIVISHKNTRLLISPSKHRVNKDIKPNKIASIRGELHKETNYAKKNYFEGGKTFINKLIPQILKDKKENQYQTMVHFKTFEEIIKDTVLKEKYQQILIPLFQEYESEQLNDNLCKEYGKIILNEINTNKLLINSKTNEPLQWLSTYSDKDKSSRPNGLSMNLNDVKEVNSIADPRIKRLAGYRLKYVNNRKEAIDKLDIDTNEKNQLKRKAETLPLFSNAIYEVRLRINTESYEWVELKDFNGFDFEKISYAKKEITEDIKNKLKQTDIESLKQSYFEKPIFISGTPIEVKKVRQLSYFQDLYEVTKGRYVYSAETFMTYFFQEKNKQGKIDISKNKTIKFLKFIDAINIINTEKPNSINYKKIIDKEKTNDEIQNGINYDLLFTLSKNDIVYLRDTFLTPEQIEEINWNDKQSLLPYLYIVKEMNPSLNKIVFQHLNIADSIKISDADAKSLFNNPDLKEQIEVIKYGTVPMLQRCIKVFTDKLGKKVAPYWEFPNGCWNKEKAKELGLIIK